MTWSLKDATKYPWSKAPQANEAGVAHASPSPLTRHSREPTHTSPEDPLSPSPAPPDDTAAPGPDPDRRPEALADQGPFPRVDGVLDRALAMVEYLREHCPWDRKQTARSLVPHLLEETHETVDAIHAGDPDALRGELGDLLLNLAFQVVVAEDQGAFSRDDVVRELEAKMMRRHPHLFGLGEPESWEAIKARERAEAPSRDAGASPAPPGAEGHTGSAEPETGADASAGALSGLARGLDPLLRAHRIQEKASGVGFDWDAPRGALEKVREELSEVAALLEEGPARPAALEEEMGDLLFAVVNLIRLSGLHPTLALEAANLKFRRRFKAVERLAVQRGLAMPGASLEALDRLWDEVKDEERQDPPPRPDPPRQDAEPDQD